MGKLIKRILIALCVLAIVAGGALAWRLRPRTQTFYTDANTIKLAKDAAAIREILWTPPEKLAGGLNADVDDYEPELSEDGQTLFFVSGRAGANANIEVCTRTPDSWSQPQSLAAINSDYDELGPELSPDGDVLYFYSDRPGGIGGYDIWMSRRQADGTWSEPSNLGVNVNSAWNDYGPATSPEGGKLYFASNRPRPGDVVETPQSNWPATLREQFEHRDYDLYFAALSDRGLAAAVRLNTLCTDANEGAPAVSPFGDFLYFASDRDGGFGGYDVYRCRIVHGAYREPTNLGEEVNTNANELDPDLSLGGYGLHFSSDRLASARPIDSTASTVAAPPVYGLYYTTSREVFSETQTQHASIDWAGLWRDIGPNLLWALLALLLSLLLLALLRDFRERKLSLLARCLLASLLLHMLLMLLLNVVEVTSALASVVRGKGKIQVSLVSSAVGDELSAQLFGQMTDVTSPEPPTIEAIRCEPTVEMQSTFDAATEVRVDSTLALQEHRTISIETAEDAPQSERAWETPRVAESVPIEYAPQSPSEIATPTEQKRMDASERAELKQPRIARQQTAKAATKPIATTQPVLPMSDEAIEPAAVELVQIERPARVLVEDAATDAPSHAIAARPTTSTVDRTPVAEAAPPAVNVAMPDDERSRERVEESPQLASARSIAPAELTARKVEPELLPQTFIGQTSPQSSTPLPIAESPTAASWDDTSTASDDWSEARDADSTNTAEPRPADDAATPTELALAPADPTWNNVRLPAEESPNATQSTDAEASNTADKIAVAPDWKPIERVDSGAAAFADSASPRFDEARITPSPSETRQTDDSTMPTKLTDAVDAAAPPASAVSTQLDAQGATSPELIVAAAAPLDFALPSETEPPAPADETGRSIGTIRGEVVDQTSGKPLPGAVVQLVLPDEQTISVEAGPLGAYELAVPDAPDNFALSASSENHVPHTTNIAKSSLGGRPLEVDFRLEPKSEFVVALEERPDVHHLGNDRFTGRINSQFQKKSEGRRYRAKFTLSASQLATQHRRGEIKLMAKGVQCPHQIRLNGHLLDTRLDEAPRDGSFGEFTAAFDPAWLRAGDNRLKIRAVECSGDLDDFEFVNIRVCLYP